MESAAFGDIRATDEVVEGDVVEVGEGDEDRRSRFITTIFVELIHCRRNASGLSGLGLSDFELLTSTSQSVI